MIDLARLTFLTFITTLTLGHVARAEGCPEARSERLAGRMDGAERAARACLTDDPDDAGTWFELSRALGYQGRHDEALHWAQRALGRYPGDNDLALWRVRLLGWSGRVAEARAAMAVILTRAPELRSDRETAVLEVDLTFWAKDWAVATEGFTRYLASWPDDADALRKRGITWLERGDTERARADFQASCRLAPTDASCAYLKDLAQRASRFQVSVEPTLSTSARGDAATTRLGVSARIVDELRVGLAGEERLQSVGDTLASDTMAYLFASWLGDGVALDGAIGVGIGADFSPELSAWLESSLRIVQPLWGSLRYWRLGYADGGAHVLSPAVTLQVGPVEIEGRYWLGLGDGGDTTHAGLVRARWQLAQWTLEAGVGAGTSADYLSGVPDDGVQGHRVALVGVRWSPSWSHRFTLAYIHRAESHDDASLVRHELALGWLMSF